MASTDGNIVELGTGFDSQSNQDSPVESRHKKKSNIRMNIAHQRFFTYSTRHYPSRPRHPQIGSYPPTVAAGDGGGPPWCPTRCVPFLERSVRHQKYLEFQLLFSSLRCHHVLPRPQCPAQYLQSGR